jgi:hypothetical protein
MKILSIIFLKNKYKHANSFLKKKRHGTLITVNYDKERDGEDSNEKNSQHPRFPVWGLYEFLHTQPSYDCVHF